MNIKIGQIYCKQTESWFNNSKKGTPVKVIQIIKPHNFICYRRTLTLLSINIPIGSRMYLNEISFKRIYMGIDPNETDKNRCLTIEKSDVHYSRNG